VLSRREVLALFGAAGAPAPAAAATTTTEAAVLSACIVRPAQTEGPCFVDEMLNRSDIRSDPAGGAAGLFARVFARLRGSLCVPLPRTLRHFPLRRSVRPVFFTTTPARNWVVICWASPGATSSSAASWWFDKFRPIKRFARHSPHTFKG